MRGLKDKVAILTGGAAGIGAVCFLAGDDAAFITGQVLSVSGGMTMAG